MFKPSLTYYLVVFIALLTISCEKETLFTKISPTTSGLVFENKLVEDEQNNVMTYEYIYNGAGIAAADLNNDGLTDVYVSGNEVPNKLFLNEGDLNFKEVTSGSGLQEKKGWKTGVTIADVNGDGWMDIYVCYSGNAPQEGFEKPVIIDYPPRANQLFINTGKTENGIPKFVDKTDEYGLGAIGTFSTQAYFFDYDLDGDLDMFLVNHANKFYSTFYNVKTLRQKRHPYFGNKLFKNENNKFTEVSETSGIHGGGLNFGLSAAISDLNLDGWPDIYVTNDYDEQDYCYLNNQDGTFTDISHTAFGHISKYSMGSDIADVNNDGFPDLFVADMLPEDNYRQKVLKGPDEYDKYSMAVDSGYHSQHMRNMLQLNKGISLDSSLEFSEVGQIFGVSNTDWSWAPLLADYDSDGYKDLFITNGYLRDYSNLDFVNYTANTTISQAKSQNREVALIPLLNKIPSTKIPNYAFQNENGKGFKKVSKAWGLDEKSVSNAAVYADFDNDGDLDLLVSDLNAPLKLYRNNGQHLSDNNFIKIKLKGNTKNTFGIGAKVIVTLPSGKKIYQEAFYGRGYQSYVEPALTIGIGKNEKADKIEVFWPYGNKNELTDVVANSESIIDQSLAKPGKFTSPMVKKSMFEKLTDSSGLDYQHQENNYVDFYYDRLMPYQMSRLGGRMAVGDINGDENDDVYFGGAVGQAGKLFLGNDDGTFIEDSKTQPWLAPKPSEKEEVAPLFFDANNDGLLDIYIVNGGNEQLAGSLFYQDHLYLNQGEGQFIDASQALPNTSFSGGVAKAADYDNDGDMDLFLGGRLDAQHYPFTPESILLRNDSKEGKVKFTRVEQKDMLHIGMVTDATWDDLDNDGWQDLILVGEWMPISIFMNLEGVFEKIQVENTSGWWSSVKTVDIDSDGDLDILAGNLGNNTQLKASPEEPMIYYVQDMDKDGNLDPLLTYYIDGKSYPIPSRDELLTQVNSLKKVYTSYDKYAKATIEDILKAANVSSTSVLTINELRSGYLLNDGDQGFSFHPFPSLAQQSMVNAFMEDDFNGDGKKEILLAGNFFPFRASMGKLDASKGTLLTWKDGELQFSNDGENLWLDGDVRDLSTARFKNGEKRLLLSRNNDKAEVFKY
nr:VCBS repeat-containing protein [uncultured Allomuricauda sp.]